MSDLDRAVATVVADCLGVQGGESVLVIVDPGTKAIGEALTGAARGAGADVVLAEMSERETNGTEPPPAIAAAMLAADVVIAPTTKSLSHTEARRAATSAGARAATLPGITVDMLTRTMAADYSVIRDRSRAVAEWLTEAHEARITSGAGTDAVFGLKGRSGISDDGDLRTPGSFGNLPAGEGFIAPVEGTAQGRIVFDGSIATIGILAEPLVVDVDQGYAVAFNGPRAEEFKAQLEPHGPEAFAVAELGIGTNDAATLTGSVLEDEKLAGTIHVAFGDNHTIGGTIRVGSHQDGIVLGPRVELDGEVVLEGGRLNPPAVPKNRL